MSDKLHSWAETIVYPAGEGGKDSPSEGDECPACGAPLFEGERVHRVTGPLEGWVHDSHVWHEGDG